MFDITLRLFLRNYCFSFDWPAPGRLWSIGKQYSPVIDCQEYWFGPFTFAIWYDKQAAGEDF